MEEKREGRVRNERQQRFKGHFKGALGMESEHNDMKHAQCDALKKKKEKRKTAGDVNAGNKTKEEISCK